MAGPSLSMSVMVLLQMYIDTEGQTALRLWVWRGRPISSHHIKGTCCLHDPSLLMLTLMTFWSPYSTLQKEAIACLMLKKGKLHLLDGGIIYINYLDFFYMGYFPIIYLFINYSSIQSFMTSGYLFHTLHETSIF
jgi:hypothetical protein